MIVWGDLLIDGTLHMVRASGGRLGKQQVIQPQQHALNSVKLMKKLRQLTYQVPLLTLICT